MILLKKYTAKILFLQAALTPLSQRQAPIDLPVLIDPYPNEERYKFWTSGRQLNKIEKIQK
jgi:hypothetical protein